MEAPSQSPQRKTVSTIEHDNITLEFCKDRGEMRLRIQQDIQQFSPSVGNVDLPLWALLEIRDWCAVNLPMIRPPEYRI